jgi:hypothetical protein
MIDSVPSTRLVAGTRIIACAVFKPALEHLRLTRRYPQLRVTYLTSRLHNMPQELEKRLLKEVLLWRKRGERIVCLYGECFPDMNDFCRRLGLARVAGIHCDEILLGRERFQEIIHEVTGTYFLERDLIVNFGKYCRKPLELDDIEIREALFRHYRRLLYLRQPSDPDLTPRVCRIADFLGLRFETTDVDYSFLESQIIELMQTQARQLS